MYGGNPGGFHGGAPASSYGNLGGGITGRPALGGYMLPTLGSNSVGGHIHVGGGANESFKIQFEKLAFFEFIHEIFAPFRLVGN